MVANCSCLPYTAAVDVLCTLVAVALDTLVHVDLVDDRDVADDLYGRYYLQGFDAA